MVTALLLRNRPNNEEMPLVCEILSVSNCRLADTLEREQEACGWQAPERDRRNARDEELSEGLDGVRLRLAEESLSQLWEGCLRPRTAVHAVIDCWTQALNMN